MTPNDKFPKETLRQIETEATVFVKGLSIEHSKAHQKSGYIAGATAWAGWKVKYDNLQAVYTGLFNTAQGSAAKYQELQAQAQRMADALEKHKEAYDYLAKEAERKYTEAYENDTNPVAAALMFNMLHKAYIEAARRTSEALQQFKDGKEVENGK